jgi:hypothetical protein
LIDDIRIWNVVRSSAEIQANSAAELASPPAGLVGNWRFDEGSGGTAADAAGEPQNASLLGGAIFATDIPGLPPASTATPTATAAVTATRTSTPVSTATRTPTSVPTATRTSTPAASPTSIPSSGQPHSLALNGTTAYAEAPHGPELTSSSWTFELWFKDDHATYNHARARLLTKGDVASNEVPFFASIDSGQLFVGFRAGGGAYVLMSNLDGVTPSAWHHLAGTFQGSTRTLTIYVDGVQRAQGVVQSGGSSGNTLPVIVGRSGASGDYFKGWIDDMRIWNVARSATEVNGNFQTELPVAPPGLVANWHFDEGVGPTAFDSTGIGENAALLGGAGWSSDVPAPLLAGSSWWDGMTASAVDAFVAISGMLPGRDSPALNS